MLRNFLGHVAQRPFNFDSNGKFKTIFVFLGSIKVFKTKAKLGSTSKFQLRVSEGTLPILSLALVLQVWTAYIVWRVVSRLHFNKSLSWQSAVSFVAKFDYGSMIKQKSTA